jgi:hypothetical protein
MAKKNEPPKEPPKKEADFDAWMHKRQSGERPKPDPLKPPPAKAKGDPYSDERLLGRIDKLRRTMDEGLDRAERKIHEQKYKGEKGLLGKIFGGSNKKPPSDDSGSSGGGSGPSSGGGSGPSTGGDSKPTPPKDGPQKPKGKPFIY